MPAGSWTDDGSMTLAAMDSLTEKGTLDLDDIMQKFIRWDREGAYTPFGRAYDQGMTCLDAIEKYSRKHDWQTCGRTGEHANGNGGLMRIMPVCLYAYFMQEAGVFSERDAVMAVHHGTLITHHHLRSCTASGIYYFLVREILLNRGAEDISLTTILQQGMNNAVSFYTQNDLDDELPFFARIRHLKSFAMVPAERISSSGYVLHTLEAALWSLVTTDSLESCLLKAVNLGDDADTVGAVAGGLAGLYYGYDSVPADWRASMQKREWLEEMCAKAAETVFH